MSDIPFDWRTFAGVAAVGASVALGFYLKRVHTSDQDNLDQKNFGSNKPTPPSNWQKDVVYVYTLPRKFSKRVPNVSPFCVKLETWLRLENIKYEVIETNFLLSPRRRQLPFVWFNGEWLEDSSFIIENLAKHFNIDLYGGLSDEEKGIAEAFVKYTDKHIIWGILYYRGCINPESYKPYCQMFYNGKVLNPTFIKDRYNACAWAVGHGRDTEEETAREARSNMMAVSRFLGDKKFLMGDQPGYVDCVMFGHLGQVVYVDMPFPHKEVLANEAQNIVSYIDRVKERLWPEYEQICDMNGTFKWD